MTVHHAILRAALLSIALGAVSVSAIAQPSGGPPPAHVFVDAATLQQVEGLREVTGEFKAARRSMIASEVSGIVADFLVREGDEVQKGDVIARLNDIRATIQKRRADADVAAARALLAEREAVFQKAERDLARLDALQERAAASFNEVEDARTERMRAVARLDQARAELLSSEAEAELAQDELDDMTIRAPFTGRIATRLTEVGQWAREGDSIVELVSLDRLEAWLDMPERFAGRFTTPGMKVLIRINAFDTVVDGKLLQVLPVMNPLSRVFTIRVEVANADRTFRPGMSVVGLAPTGENVEVLTVHKDAILRDNAGAYLFYDADSVARAARITELFPVGDRVAIRSLSLQPSSMVVVEGNERLYPGARLNAQARSSGATDAQASRIGEGN